MEDNQTKKAKNMMYVQQMSHLPLKSIDKLVETINEKLDPKKFALILHDKDIDEQRTLVEPHVHVMMQFENSRSIKNVAKLLNDKPQNIEAWRGKAENGYAYLIHATDKARAKHQYDPNEVIASFDFPSLIESITQKVVKAKKSNDTSNVKLLLDMLYMGMIEKDEVESKLTGSQYGRYHRQIDEIWNKRLEQMAKKWKHEMISNDKPIEVIWIYGSSGTGKTSLAKDYAKKKNQPYCFAGSSRDIFQTYKGEHTLILDELRPSVIPYQDLLRILDPFGIDVMAPSRYVDKALACDLIIITSPYNPLEFYREQFGFYDAPAHVKRKLQNIDSFEQLLRRITLVIEMNEFWINGMEYNKSHGAYEQMSNVAQNNRYSSRNRQTNKTDTITLFNSMFE